MDRSVTLPQVKGSGVELRLTARALFSIETERGPIADVVETLAKILGSKDWTACAVAVIRFGAWGARRHKGETCEPVSEETALDMLDSSQEQLGREGVAERLLQAIRVAARTKLDKESPDEGKAAPPVG